MKMELRPYQQEAHDSIYHGFETHPDSNSLVVVPTGGGKSPIIGTFVQGVLTHWPDTKILMLVHVRELVAQNFATLIKIWPEAPATIYSAGLGQKNMTGRIVMASIQSIFRKAYELQFVDMILIDEAHLIPPEGEGMYHTLIKALMDINPDLKIIGFTATPFRAKQGWLTSGENPLFHRIAYEIGLRELIDAGWLSPLVTKHTATQLDVSAVKTTAGDFNIGDLAAAIDRDQITTAAVDEIVRMGADRRSWLIFGTNVEHAEHIRDEIRLHGITCETVTGETSLGERDRLIRAFKRGEIRALTNAQVLTTGFDAPAVDMLAVIRPTKSPGLWLQILGRGTRPSPDTGKTNCLVLDFGGNTLRHGPADMIRPKEPGMKGSGTAPIKICPSCQCYQATAVRICPDCGHEFPEPRVAIEARASSAPILSVNPGKKEEWVDVTSVRYSRHQKDAGAVPTLKVTYHCGMITHAEWVCFEHTGYARQKAATWWFARMGTTATMPNTVAAALAVTHTLPPVRQIRLKPEGKYLRVESVRFGDPVTA